jgi:hypothetical protein
MNLLEELVRRGFTFHVFEAYPKQLGAVKSNFIVLLDVSDDGRWMRFSSPGRLIDDQIGLLIERGGKQVFMHKTTEFPADAIILEQYRQFNREIDEVLALQKRANESAPADSA